MSAARERDVPKRVLLVRLSALGDVIHVLPALDALRRGLPRARIAWLVEDRAASVLQGHPQLDAVHVLPRGRAIRTLLRERRPLAALGALGGAFAGLRRERFDLAIDFQGNIRSALSTLLSGARVRVGWGGRSAKEGASLFYTRAVRSGPRSEPGRPAPAVHKVERALALVRAVGIATHGARAQVAVPAPARALAAAFFAGLPPPATPPSRGGTPPGPGRPVIGLHPGVSAFGALKQWAPERFAQAARALAADAGALSLVTWGPGERDLAERVVALAGGAAVIGPETASILELAALYERCATVVGSDTGPIHLAAAMGVPVVGLYGPKDPRIYAPWSSALDGPSPTIWDGAPCSPCTLRRCGNPICMDAIPPRDVARAVQQILTERSVSFSPPPP